MFAYLKGKIFSKGSNYIVVENRGLGYKVFVLSSLLKDLHKGQEAEFYLHTYVREDQISLYGFLSPDELELFELLVAISGVGPKMALGILSGASVSSIKSAIAAGDARVFTKVSGVGKKTAERIVIELKEKIGAREGLASSHELSESLDALSALGYSKREAREALKKVPKDLTDSKSIIKEALKILGKR